MHHTHTTPAFVLGSGAHGEANRVLSLLTRDLGLVRAVCKSARKETSTLRFHTQNFSFSTLALVRGREMWRVTGAVSSANIAARLASEPEKQRIVVQIAALLTRLLQGEEADPELFDLIERGFDFLTAANMPDESVRDFEHLFVLRILAALGYVGRGEEPDIFLDESPFSRELLEQVSSRRREAVRKINEALEASGL